jgi:hypothetical protein
MSRAGCPKEGETMLTGKKMVTRRLTVVTGLIAVLGVLTASPSHAWLSANRMNYLTFSGSVALPGVELGAGTYIFELATPMTDHSLVRVLSRDRSKVYLLAFTNAIERPTGMSEGKVVTLGESLRGTPPPILAWYPIGDSTGREFIYRK